MLIVALAAALVAIAMLDQRIGDGPGGLSAALFLAKNGSDVVVFGQNKTAMNWALLRNYLGIPEIAGTEFQKVARAQVGGYGVTVRDDAASTAPRAGKF